MAVQPPEDEVKEGAPGWMTTFADLMSLLLTFFVLLLSFSSTEIEKFNAVTGSIRSAFGMHSPMDIINNVTSHELKPYSVPSDNKEAARKDKLVAVKLRQALEKSDMTAHGKIEVTEDGVTLQMDGDVLFESGKADIRPEAHALLDELAGMLATIASEIEVQGHTDDVPIATGRYPSNWELSTSRAGTAVRYLQGQGVPPARLRASGFADSRPIAPNDSAKNRGKNRRIEFVFVDPSNK